MKILPISLKKHTDKFYNMLGEITKISQNGPIQLVVKLLSIQILVIVLLNVIKWKRKMIGCGRKTEAHSRLDLKRA